MGIELLKILVITVILILSISLLTIPLAFLLMWLDNKGIIEKITKLFRRKKDGKEL